MSGWYDLTGFAGGEPLGPYSAYTDFICWPFLLSAILVALEVRDATGRGQYIDHAQLETSVHSLAPGLLDLQLNDHLATRRGNAEDYAAPNNAYRVGNREQRTGDSKAEAGAVSQDDRWIALTVASDAEWRALCAACGYPETAADARF